MKDQEYTGEEDKLTGDIVEMSDNTGNKPPEDLPKITHLSGMYQDWFLDYASYVILERAVPHLHDGLKPVQRRILHSMKRMDDGRFNKVANIIGHTMQFHPHGDASIGDALVQIGQKDLLVETQGNWGNILTGDGAAAPRYIEARLSKFALEVVFNPKTTAWKLSYDGRNKEPVTLPVKFPLLLAQGVEGIAVGLASKILPHNFNELIDASIAYLKGQTFELFPDFPTGGYVDVSRYNDGIRGGAVKVRAKISKLDKKTLVINEIPFGKTTSSLIDSILKANDKGKIKIRKIDDNTAGSVEILVHLAPGISPDKTIDALYAFTDCEVSISPNSCVIEDDKPRFLGVTEMLRISADNTKELLRQELNIRMEELLEDWHMSSLEKIFFEQKIYRELEKESKNWDMVIDAIDKAFDPFKELFRRPISRDDLLKLTDKPVRKISNLDIKKVDEYIKGLEKEMKQVQNYLDHLVKYAIDYFARIKEKYGKGRDRSTEIRNFDTIEATKVVVANEKLYVNFEEGFAGYGMKKDQYICDCSDIDDVIAIRQDGTYVINKVSEKDFFGNNLVHVNVFKRNDNRTIYNVVYRDGKNGAIMMKRCAINGVTREKEYTLTKGTPDSRILHLSVNPNGEAEVLRVTLKPRPRLKNLHLEVDFAELAIKGRDSQGNILTRYAIHRIQVKEKGGSTLGGLKVWFDEDVLRLNHDGRGKFLGEFQGNDKILVMTRSGYFRFTNYDPSNHFEDDVMVVEKYEAGKVFTAIYYDGEQKLHYMKRFQVEMTDKNADFAGDEGESRLLCLSGEKYPRFELIYGGTHAKRPSEIVEADSFIAVKGYKAKGKRLSAFTIHAVNELESLVVENEEELTNEPVDGDVNDDADNFDPDTDTQMSLDL
jgi:topoisomerase IV subunit A